MRAIDADVLKDRLQALSYDDWNQGVSTTWANAYAKFADMVEDMPTIEPERKGKWIETDDGWDGIYYDCSECGCSWTLIDGTPFDNGMKYCPSCGAKMEVGDNGK